VEVSALLGRGIIAPVSVRLQNGVCFLHHPLPATDSARFYNRTCRTVPRRCYGLTLFRATSTGQEAPAFLPMIVLSACPHQARGTSDHVPFWSEPVSRFGSSSLTAFISGSRYVEPLTQPSASTGFRLPVSRDDPREYHVPLQAATLSVRFAQGRYQPCTAPRLPAAEHRVALRPTLWSCDNSLHGFSPRLTTHFHRMAVGSDPE
jgi:hypothetical protein